MTPLYHRLVKRLTLPARDRAPLVDPHGLLDDLSDVHCFDCMAIGNLMADLSQQEWNSRRDTGKGVLSRDLIFPPAPRSWIEWPFYNTRAAFFDSGSGVSLVTPGRQVGYIAMRLWDGDAVEEDVECYLGDTLREFQRHIVGVTTQFASNFLSHAKAAIAIINSPRVVNRVERQPHKSLARRVAHQEFKVHPWHEIKLEVFKPRDCGEDGGEGWLTGRRALHFCRAFIRIRNGKLEHVRSHWRGDPSLGVRQASYRVGP
jgi:hypothetical protein